MDIPKNASSLYSLIWLGRACATLVITLPLLTYPSSALAATWSTSFWYGCDANQHSRTVTCKEGDTVVEDSQCPPPKPITSLPCTDAGIRNRFMTLFPTSWHTMARAQIALETIEQVPAMSLGSYLPEPDTDMSKPKMLSIGDSISLGYMFSLRSLVKDAYVYYHPTHNGASTQNGKLWIDEYLEFGPYEVILVNWGLHDSSVVRRTTASGTTYERKTPLEHYRANLQALLTRLKNTGATVIWVRTTSLKDPVITALGVPDTGQSPFKMSRQVDVDDSNRIADQVTTSLGIPQIDLAGTNRFEYHADKLHFSALGSDMQARYINAELRRIVASRPTPTAFWHTAPWSACSSGARTRTVQCTDVQRNVLGDTRCSHIQKPATSVSCTPSYFWKPLAWGACTPAGTRTRRIVCRDEKGTVSWPDSYCAQAPTVPTQEFCGAGLNSTWDISPWGACTGGVERRTVVCKNANGVRSPESSCPQPKPPTSQSCTAGGTACTFNGTSISHGNTVTAYAQRTVPSGQTCQSQVRTCTNGTLSGTYQFSSCTVGQTYSWDSGAWGACTSGTQTRTVQCKNASGTVVADSLCPSPKPSTSQSCTEITLSCSASNFTELKSCIEQYKTSSATRTQQAEIIVAAPIQLGVGEVIDLTGLKRVTLRGATPSIVISETYQRAMDTSTAEKFIITAYGGTSDVTIKDIRVEDAQNVKAFYEANCIPGANTTNPNLWKIEYCYAPIIVGGTSTATTDSADRITLENVKVTSYKAALLHLRRINTFRVDNSDFTGGGVFGIFFQGNFLKSNVAFTNSRFSDASQNGFNISNVRNLLIENNKIFNNHIRTYYRCGSAPCPGGQIYINDASAGATGVLDDVKILDNEIYITSQHASLRLNGGIEITTSQVHPMTNFLIARNTLYDIPKGAIGAHYHPTSKHSNIVIRDNVARNTLWDFSPAYPIQRTISAVSDPWNHPTFTFRSGIRFENNTIVNTTSTVAARNVSVRGSISDTEATSCIQNQTSSCLNSVAWTITTTLPQAVPQLRVNGVILKTYPAGTLTATELIPWTDFGETDVISIHLDSSPYFPIASIDRIGRHRTSAQHSWSPSSWSTCTGGTQTRTVQCKTQSGTVVADSLCPPPKPETSQQCTVGGTACVFNGTNIPHGNTVTAYAQRTVPSGQTCQSQVRTCTNGTLSGTYQFSSCTVGQTYSWDSGAWGACTSGTQTRTVQCKNASGTVVTDSLCPSPKPPATRQCGATPLTYAWYLGDYSVCSGGVQTRTVQCKASTGAAAQDAQCTTAKPSTSRQCSSADYAWVISAFGECVSNLKSRTVQCKDSDRKVFADAYCPSPKPVTQTSCATGVTLIYDWQMSNFGSCESGFQSRKVWCRGSDGKVHANSFCTASKPAERESCTSPVSFEWFAGSYSDCVNSSHSRAVVCKGSDGATYPDARCSGVKPAAVSACTVPTTYEWYSSTYTSCVGGFKTRVVLCKGSDTSNYPDASCAGAKPEARTACTVPNEFSWFVSNFGVCTQGLQSRTVRCRGADNSFYPDVSCELPKPDATRTCQ